MPNGSGLSGKHKSVSTSRFAMVPRNDVPRSAFDVQHTHKTTFNAGYLVPIYVDEVLPGDSMRVRMTAFARLATPIVPIMDNLIMETFWFFVPNRLVWTNWARFMGERATITDSTMFLTPQQSVTADVVGSLADYFGIYQNSNGGQLDVLAFPFRAYNLIWNEFFRDQDLQNPVVVDVDDGPDAMADYVLLRRGKRHDYFTSARPWPQKPHEQDTIFGVAEFPADYVTGGNFTMQNGTNVGAPVSGFGVAPGAAPIAGPQNILNPGNRTFAADQFYISTGGANALLMDSSVSGVPQIRVLVNDMRTAMMIQRMLEMNSRGGTRYTEFVRTHFGVTSPDARLQRPEYLGGGRSMITVNPVAQTSGTQDPLLTGQTTVLGELAGIGTAVASGHGFSQSFTEHGTIIGLVNVRADLTYQQGVHRMWFRQTRWDFYVPALAHLGEQAIFRKEIFALGVGGVIPAPTDDVVFGYQERWSEYKYKPSRISGAFRSPTATPLDVWHLAQFFSTAPVLNGTFIEENPPVARVLQVNTTDSFHFLFDSLFDCRLVRCMPMYSIPGLGSRL